MTKIYTGRCRVQYSPISVEVQFFLCFSQLLGKLMRNLKDDLPKVRNRNNFLLIASYDRDDRRTLCGKKKTSIQTRENVKTTP